MKARLTLGAMVLAMIGAAVSLQAIAQEGQAPPSKSPVGDINKIKDDLRLREQILSRTYQEFERALLQLKQRLERSGKKEDKDKAAVLGRVLDTSRDSSIAVKFEQMVDYLQKNKFANLGDMKIAADQAKALADDLRKILDMMREDNSHNRLRDERLRLEDLVKKLEEVIHNQKVTQSITELNKTDPKELGKIQAKVTGDTGKIIKAIDGKGNKSDPGGEAKNSKGDPKESKDAKGAGESKDAGKNSEGKKGESKEGGADSKDKKGDAKGDPKGGEAGKGKEGKEGEAKSGKGSEGKEGDAKGSKGSEGKGDPKDNKGGDKGKEGASKDGGEKSPGDKKGDAKPGEKSGKGSESKPGDAKSGKGAESKEGGAKDSKAGKSGEAKPGDSKSGGKPSESSDSKQGEAKPGSKSDSQGQAKQGGQKGGEPPPGGEKGDNQPPPKGGPQDPKDNVANSKKQVQDAEYKMKEAEKKIAAKDNKPASDHQGDAIKDLERAKKKLEELLRQIREEELERLLAALQARCEKMLGMQIQVLVGTENVYRQIDANADKKPAHQNKQDSLKLSDQEKEIVVEADKAIEMLEAEGSAVAFPEIFRQVRQDMAHVQRRLEVTDVGIVTQAIEKDIIDTLKEMVEALKKAQKELADKKSPPGKPPEGSPPPNADQKLLDQIAELKMIRSMQIRVNSRTETYGKQYVPREGEQTSDPIIRRELHNLRDRQERIYDITNRIAKGDNK